MDWFRNYYEAEILNQPLELTENIINLSNTVDVNGIFTVLIPEGTRNGEPLYLDFVQKTVTKVKIQGSTQTGNDDDDDGNVDDDDNKID